MQPRKAAGVRRPPKVRNVPEELRRVMQLLDAQQRRQVLEEQLAAWQRQALQAWMLDRKKVSKSASMLAVEDGMMDTCHAAAASEKSEMVAALSEEAAKQLLDTPKRCQRDRAYFTRQRAPPTQSLRGVLTHTKRHGKTYYALAVVKHAMLTSIGRRELAHAISDYIVLVAIRKRVWDIGQGDLYRDLLPRAIKEVTEEQGFDRELLRVKFQVSVRGTYLRFLLPPAHWEVALRCGAELLDVLPPQGRPGVWRKRGVSVEMEEEAWQVFKRKYSELCSSKRNVATVARQLSQIEVKFGRRRAAAVEAWQRKRARQEKSK
eukprot:5880840-Amphidinium_carterae.1